MKTTHRWKQGNHLSQHQALLHQALKWWFAYACQLTFPYILGEKLALVTQEECRDDHLQSRTKEKEDPKKRRMGQRTTAPVLHPRPSPSGPKLILLIPLGKLSPAFWRQFPRHPPPPPPAPWQEGGGGDTLGFAKAGMAVSGGATAEGIARRRSDDKWQRWGVRAILPGASPGAMWRQQSPSLRAVALLGSGSLRELAGRVQKSIRGIPDTWPSLHFPIYWLTHNQTKLLLNTAIFPAHGLSEYLHWPSVGTVEMWQQEHPCLRLLQRKATVTFSHLEVPCSSQKSPVLSDELLTLRLGPPFLYHRRLSASECKRISHLKSYSLSLQGPSARAASPFEKKLFELKKVNRDFTCIIWRCN